MATARPDEPADHEEPTPAAHDEPEAPEGSLRRVHPREQATETEELLLAMVATQLRVRGDILSDLADHEPTIALYTAADFIDKACDILHKLRIDASKKYTASETPFDTAIHEVRSLPDPSWVDKLSLNSLMAARDKFYPDAPPI